MGGLILREFAPLFILTIPDEYFEAAKIDGMGYFQMYFTIVIPLSKAAMITMMIYSVFMVWNQYVYPLIYLTNKDQYTLQIGLGVLQERLIGQFGPLMAAATMVSIPSLVIYLIFQRYLTEGITMTEVKG